MAQAFGCDLCISRDEDVERNSISSCNDGFIRLYPGSNPEDPDCDPGKATTDFRAQL